MNAWWGRTKRRTRSTPATIESLEVRAVLAAGDLDTTFDGDGLRTDSLSAPLAGGDDLNGDIVTGVAQQPDGKLVVSGWAAINSTMRDEDNRVIGAETDINGTPNQVAFVRRYNANGSPDTTFGNQATKFLPFPLGFDGVTPDSYWNTSVGWDIAVQSNGKIVMVKTTLNGLDARAVPFLIQAVRLNADGTRDTTFGTTTFGPQNGFAQAGFGGGQGLSLQGMSVAISPTSGKIAVAGSAINMDAFDPNFTDVYRPMVVQFNADGSLDTNFGGDDINNPGQKSGIFELPLGTATGRFLDVAYGPGDKLIASGYWTGTDGAGQQLATESAELLVARINTNGTLDATYGVGGLGRFAQGTQAIGRTLVVNSDGSAVVAGYTDTAGSGQQFAPIRFAPDVVQSESATQRGLVVKFDANGQVDDTFGTDGARLLDPNAFRAVTSLIPRPQGGFYLGGHAGGDFAVASMSAAGDLLTAFPTIKRTVGAGHDVPYALMRQADGKLVLGGFTTNGTDRNLALMRLQAEPAVPVNVAPVLDNSGTPFYVAGVGSRLPVELTNGVLVSSFLATGAAGDPITDGNGDPDGIAVTEIDKSFGSWQYSTVANPVETDWVDMDAAGMVSGSSALLLKADATTRVRLKSTLKPHHEGSVAQGFLPLESKLDAGLTFRAWDQTSGTAGSRANTTSNGGSTPFSAATETLSTFFETRLFRSFNANAQLNVYTLQAEFEALTAAPTSYQDRATASFTGFTVFLSPLTSAISVTGMLRSYYGVQFNDDGTETDMGYRYLTTNAGEAANLELLGRADKRPLRQGAYFRELGVNAGTAITGYIATGPRTGFTEMFQIYRTDAVGKPTRPPGTVEGGTPTSTRSQEQGDHVYTTNRSFEKSKTGTWRDEASRGFVRELSPGLVAGAAFGESVFAAATATMSPEVISTSLVIAASTRVGVLAGPIPLLATEVTSERDVPLGLIGTPPRESSAPSEANLSSPIVSNPDEAKLAEIDADECGNEPFAVSSLDHVFTGWDVVAGLALA
jgi:uncharacterized delta-60 repeat protein